MNFENGRGPVISAKNGKELYTGILEIIKKGTMDRKNSHLKLPEPRGMAFEGLAREALFGELFSFLGFEVFIFSGFISIEGIEINKQIDLIIAKKKPKEWLMSGYHISDYRDIIAIVEVKTTLSFSDFKDAVEHLGFVRDKILESISIGGAKSQNQSHLVRKISSIIECGSKIVIDEKDFNDLNQYQKFVHSIVYAEAVLPLSFLIAFSGYSTEEGFHRAFIRILDENKYKANPLILPTVVCTEKFSISKGLVYPFSFAGKGFFDLVTMKSDPLLSALQSIINKIAMEFGLRDIQEHRFKENFPKMEPFVQFKFIEGDKPDIRFVSDFNLIKNRRKEFEYKSSRLELTSISQEKVDWLIYSLISHSAFYKESILLIFSEAIRGILMVEDFNGLDGEAMEYLVDLSQEILDYEILSPRHHDGSIELWNGLNIYECRDSFYIGSAICEAPPDNLVAKHELRIDSGVITLSSEILYINILKRLNKSLMVEFW